MKAKFHLLLSVLCVPVLLLSASQSASAQATIVVSSTNDSGGGTLRQAILDANASTNDLTVIQFNLPGQGVNTITPASLLPFITRPVLIDGTSQPGYAGSPLVEINGSSAGPCYGLEVRAGNSTIRGLTINRFAARGGIALATNGNNQVQSCWIGTDSTGTNAAGNGVSIVVALSSSNLIGGVTSSARNVISGNNTGIWLLGGAFNRVQGNYIGMDATGLRGLGNREDGVFFNCLFGTTNYATDSIVGGTDPGARNLLSGNGLTGVALLNELGPTAGTGPARNQILGNYIGLDRNGSAGWINGDTGILISNAVQTTIGTPNAGNVISASGTDGIGIWGLSPSNTIQGNYIGTDFLGLSETHNGSNGVHIVDNPYNTIGGTAPGAGNVISGNRGNGIEIDGAYANANVVQGNLIGTDSTGQSSLGNGKDGILLSTNGVRAQGSSTNTIGVVGGPGGNVISGNGRNGVEIGPGALANQIMGNTIGMSRDGQVRVANAWNGVALLDSTNNTIGGEASGAGNLISGNISNGVLITTGPLGSGSRANFVQANHIGAVQAGNGGCGVFVHGSSDNWIGGLNDADKNWITYNGSNLMFHGHGVVIESGTNNPILGNLIYGNAGRGIDLGNDSFDLPQFGGLTNGQPNGRQNYPVVTRTYFTNDGTHEITWTLTTSTNMPNWPYRIEVYRNSAPDPSGFGEGETFMYSTTVVTDTNGVVVFTNLFLPSDSYIAATATDLVYFNTSEFSPIDTDGDGIPDAWETRGIDVNEDGVIDLTLQGAEPLRKDIYVEIDTMAGRTPDMSHLNNVVIGRYPDFTDGFFSAPVNNPSPLFGDGINLHLELDETNVPLPSVGWTTNDAWASFQAIKTNYFGTVAQRPGPANPDTNAANILAAKRLVYHYCLFADSVAGAGGQGGLVGDSFYVAASFNPTGVFMHELGHNLGLQHGGIDGLNYKPNYHSIMNYQWQNPNSVTGTNWTLDYSRSDFKPLNEAHLDENVGVGGPPSHQGINVKAGPRMVSATNLFGTSLIVPEYGPVDWNGNGTSNETDVARDIDFLGNNNISLTNVLVSSQDWPRLRFYFLDSKEAFNGSPPNPTDDLSPTELATFDALGSGWGVLQFSAPTYSISETGGVAVITVTKVAELATNLSVSYASVAGGTAAAGVNYTAVSGTLSFGPSDTSQTFNVPVLHDNVATGPLTVQLQLSNPTGGAQLGWIPQATLTIADVDPPTTFTVVNTNDSGAGSFRQALLNVNAAHGLTVINFNLTNLSLTITPASVLPTVTNAVTIDGTTQPGYSGKPRVELNGASAGGASDGLTLSGGASIVRGLVINRFGGNGLVMRTKGRNTVQGCYIGLNVAGTARLPNGDGVYLASAGNMIGGTTTAQRNFISGNNNRGIWINDPAATNTQVLGDVIGLGTDGSAQGNGAAGVSVKLATSSNTIGGTAAGAGNVISGNGADGIESFTASNSIFGNFIGTTLAGNGSIGNGGNGVTIYANGNVLGGARIGAGNVIGGNGGYGISLFNASATLIQHNQIGVDSMGNIGLTNQLGGILLDGSSQGNQIGGASASMGNTVAFNNGPGVFVRSDFSSNNVIRANRIYANSQLGIALGQNGSPVVNTNDPGDTDLGANGLQNYPVLSTASNSAAGTLITGSLNSIPNAQYTLDFYASVSPDPSGYGQGQFWLGTTNVTTGSSGNATFTAAVGWPQLPGSYITATTTDPAGNSSEFSASPTIQAATGPNVFQFSQTTYSVSETGRVAVITVTRTAQVLTNNSISYSTMDGTAIGGVNYTPASGTLNFGPSTASQIFIVPILHDNVATGPRTVQLQLSNPTGGAQLGSIPLATLTIADVDPRTNAQSVINLHSFENHNGGNTPICDLALSGNTLYGTTEYGGSSGYGTVFKVNTDGSGYALLYSFTNHDDGEFPYAGVIVSGDTLYGTTYKAGYNYSGTIFSIKTNGTGFTVVYNFPGDTDGYNPVTPLVLSGDVLYGTAWNGGSSNGGVVFAVNTDGTGYTNLCNFDGGPDGSQPLSGLLLAGSTLYGTTAVGGGSFPHSGTVFKVNTDSTGFSTLHRFTGVGDDGYRPLAGLVLSGQTLYGTTDYGGVPGNGAVFKVNTDGTGYTTLYNFPTPTNGFGPTGVLALDGDTLYGTTQEGLRPSDGMVFKINTNGSNFATIHIFTNGIDGGYPYGGVLFSAGWLYGTTSEGGTTGAGAVYAINVGGAPMPITLNLMSSREQLVFTWSDAAFSLQAAPFASGPWTNVPGATSPFTNSSFNLPELFYRLQAQ